MSVPTLNLRAVKPDAAVPSSARAALSHAPRCQTVDSIVSGDVSAITDVAVLQQKLMEAQRVLVGLENRYERSLEAKRQQLASVTAALTELMTSGDDEHNARLRSTRVGKTDRGVQVGYPSVPSSLSTTPRSTRDPTSGRVSRPGPSRVTSTYAVPRYGVSARSSYTARPMTSATTTATGPAPAMASPRGTRDAGVASATPFRPYQAATRRTNPTRAATPRY